MKNLIVKKGENGKYGFVDDAGNWLIEPKFDEADDFIEGLAHVLNGEKPGFINPDGSWAIKEINGEPDWSFSEGLAWVYVNGKFGYINRNGS